MNKKRALVTGGTRGIGKATSIMLAKKGYDLIIIYRSNEEKALETKKEIEEIGVNCTLLKLDIAEFDTVYNTLLNEVEQNGTIEVVVFNAAIRKDILFPLMEKKDWDSVVDVNFKSFFYVVRPLIKNMFGQKFGRIIVMSSTSGLTGMPGQVNYASTKAGIIGAAKSLAVELASRNITVNVITPGYIETEMIADFKDKFKEIKKTIPARRMGKPEDIANLIEFLITDKASYITGQVIGVNGGIFT